MLLSRDPPPMLPSSPPATSQHSTYIGAITGGVIGGIAGLVTIIAVILLSLEARRKSKAQTQIPAAILIPRSSPKHEREGRGRPLEEYRSRRFEKDGV